MHLIDMDDYISAFEEDLSTVILNIDNKQKNYKESLGIEKEIHSLKQEIDLLKEQTSALKLELDTKLKENEILKKTLAGQHPNVAENEKITAELIKGLQVKESDNFRITKAREILNIGKDFTGIRWDFSAPPDVAKGYIANKQTRDLEPFEINKNSSKESEVQAFLWNQIEMSSTADWSDLVKLYKDPSSENKENLNNN